MPLTFRKIGVVPKPYYMLRVQFVVRGNSLDSELCAKMHVPHGLQSRSVDNNEQCSFLVSGLVQF